MNEEIDIILSRYFSGEATNRELRILDTWLAHSEENEEQFYQMSLLYQHIGEQYQMPAIDSKRALSQFKTYIHNKQNNRILLFFRNPLAYRVAAAIAILVVTVFGLFFMFNRSFKTVQLVAVNEQQKFELFENTEVTLFPGAEIVYDTKIKNKVQLKGKASFTIDSKTSVEGIVVQVGETFVKDIGTVFTIDATTPEVSIAVSVTEGEVLFYTNTNSGISVKANQTAVYDTEIKQFRIMETVHAPILQEIIFQNTSLRNAIELIQARYGVNILVNSNQFNEIMLNVTFNQNESIEYVLDIISATISAQWSKKGENYIIIPEN
jgi:ferric-dicitrate binding protein FerR (iron transport regulator)